MLRFAKNTSSDLDLNNLRVAILNYVVSKQRSEELLIRIDDTDKESTIEGKEKEILEILDLFSIEYKRVVAQSENIKYHTGMAMKLLLDKKGFNCFCSEEALEQDKQKALQNNQHYSYSGFCLTISDETKFHCNAPFVVRLKKPEYKVVFKDQLRGDLEFEPYEVDSIIMLKHDKTPTHDFASGVDDMLYDISCVIQEEDELFNTPKQIHIRKSLGYDKKIEYIHIPKIVTNNHTDSLLVNSLIQQGFLPVAIVNYLMVLGYETPKEIFTLEDAVKWFDISKLSLKNEIFDFKRLCAINNEHLKQIDDLRLSKLLGYADEDLGKVAKVYLQKYDTLVQLKEKIDNIFAVKPIPQASQEQILQVKECIQGAPFMPELETLVKYIEAKTALSKEVVEKSLGYLITAEEDSIDLGQIYVYIRNYLGEIVK
ncbi:MAG: glutamate--tRNA ligase [Campylobacterales bacterium]|nr:glutamate--tRNA ligase [Campylobacterales bacterium]